MCDVAAAVVSTAVASDHGGQYLGASMIEPCTETQRPTEGKGKWPFNTNTCPELVLACRRYCVYLHLSDSPVILH